MGEFEKGIIKQANQQRKALPDKIANAPMIEIGLEMYWEAFLILCSERVQDGAIPWRAMQAYALEIGIEDVDDRQEFYFVMCEMDRKFIDMCDKKRTKNRDLNKTRGKSGVKKRS